MQVRIGLEVHIELQTATKLFCGCKNSFGEPPNRAVCPVCLGMPGAMPYLNGGAVELAVRAALGMGCAISPVSFWHRKQYDYPDLPKGYQITQGGVPFATGGALYLQNGHQVPLERIHLEEDAGKLVHRGNRSLADDNRAGVPLIELVTRPAITSADEAAEFVEQLALTMRWLGVSDCNMNEGSMRCDVNLSMTKDGKPGVKCEIKNINSVKYIRQAALAEEKRQTDLLEQGFEMIQQTRRFDEKTGQTLPMREKETSTEYGFLPEPDLPPLCLDQPQVARIAAAMPLSYPAGMTRLEQLGVEEKKQKVLAEYPGLCRYLIAVAEQAEKTDQATQAGELLARWITGGLFAKLVTKRERQKCSLTLPPADAAKLVCFVQHGRCNARAGGAAFAAAMTGDQKPLQQIFNTPCNEKEGDFPAKQSLDAEDDQLLAFCHQAILALPNAAGDVQAGKAKAIAPLVGKVMTLSKGEADPQRATKMLHNLLSQNETVNPKQEISGK